MVSCQEYDWRKWVEEGLPDPYIVHFCFCCYIVDWIAVGVSSEESRFDVLFCILDWFLGY